MEEDRRRKEDRTEGGQGIVQHSYDPIYNNYIFLPFCLPSQAIFYEKVTFFGYKIGNGFGNVLPKSHFL